MANFVEKTKEMSENMKNIFTKMDIYTDLKPTAKNEELTTFPNDLYKYQTNHERLFTYDWEIGRSTEFSPEAVMWIAFVIAVILLSMIAMYYNMIKQDHKKAVSNQNDVESICSQNLKLSQETLFERISIVQMEEDNDDQTRAVI